MNAGHCNLFDRLVNEITKFSSGTEINYKRGNNSEGTLIAMPVFQTLCNYEKSFKAESSISGTIIKAVLKTPNVSQMKHARHFWVKFTTAMRTILFPLQKNKEKWAMGSLPRSWMKSVSRPC